MGVQERKELPVEIEILSNIDHPIPKRFEQPSVFLPLPQWLPQGDSEYPEVNDWLARYRFLDYLSVSSRRKDLATEILHELESLSREYESERIDIFFPGKEEKQKKRLEEIAGLISRLIALQAECADFISHKKHYWDRIAFNNCKTVGGLPAERSMIARMCSERYRGRVLEAMCGFNSSFFPSNSREVIAIDGSREMLYRYPFQRRERICADLSKLQASGECIPCFGASSFSAVVTSCGYKYLSKPELGGVLREYRRILKRGGKVVFIENPQRHYASSIKRPFEPDTCAADLRSAGFCQVSVSDITEYVSSALALENPFEDDFPFPSSIFGGTFYLAEAVRP